jgi:hypothetical protein
MAAFDIVESDMFDGQANNQKPNPIKCEVCGKDIEGLAHPHRRKIASKTKRKWVR